MNNTKRTQLLILSLEIQRAGYMMTDAYGGNPALELLLSAPVSDADCRFSI